MSAARDEHAAGSLLDVTAFFFMHGAVHPTKIDDSCNYSLTGTKLPLRTQLYAPKILGKSYHATDIINFVSGLKNRLDKGHESFSEFCFSEIVVYERKQVEQMKQEIKDSDFIRFMESGNTSEPIERKKRRLFLEGAIVQKSQIRWDEHEYFISEKSYYVIGRDTILNCIMFFCDISPINSLNIQEIELSDDKIITVYVSYNKKTNLFKITFDKSRDFIFSFEELNQIVQNVVTSFTNAKLDFNLALFDFTCCVTSFNDDCLRNLTPTLLSSVTLLNRDVPLPKLIYGTVSEDRQREIKSAIKRGLLAGYDSDSFSDKESLSSPSTSPSPAHQSTYSPRPVRAKPLLMVNLLNGVESFADFEPISKFDSRPRSLSPNTGRTSLGPEEVDGGSRRRRRRRHVGNKVSRKLMTRRYHQRNRHTKLHSKRSKRRRGNTKSKH
jgi:hypothetical protein